MKIRLSVVLILCLLFICLTSCPLKAINLTKVADKIDKHNVIYYIDDEEYTEQIVLQKFTSSAMQHLNIQNTYLSIDRERFLNTELRIVFSTKQTENLSLIFFDHIEIVQIISGELVRKNDNSAEIKAMNDINNSIIDIIINTNNNPWLNIVCSPTNDYHIDKCLKMSLRPLNNGV